MASHVGTWYDETMSITHGYVVMIATRQPGGDTASAYRGYIVAEHQSQQAKYALADRTFVNETVNILGKISIAALNDLRTSQGMTLRL